MSRTAMAAIYRGNGPTLELVTLPVPEPAAGEAVVRVECCTVCGSDLHTLTGARREVTPSILGHEILGRVEDVGDTPPVDQTGRPLEPGDRITWSTVVSCGSCDRCERGLPQKCRSVAKYGHALAEGRMALAGGLAEYVLLRPGSAVVRVDEALPAEVVCPASCATATVAAALRAAGDVRGRRVLVVGAGMLGLTATAMAATAGATSVVACDLDERRLELARRFGTTASVHWNDRETLDPFDIVLELSGAPPAVEWAAGIADVGGTVVLVGSVMPSPPVPVDPESIVRRCLTIRGVHNYAPRDLVTAVDFLATSGTTFPFADLVEDHTTLAEINPAITRAIAQRPIRLAVRP